MGMMPHEVLQGGSVWVGMGCSVRRNVSVVASLKMVNGGGICMIHKIWLGVKM
jgi:hypothetical protein